MSAGSAISRRSPASRPGGRRLDGAIVGRALYEGRFTFGEAIAQVRGSKSGRRADPTRGLAASGTVRVRHLFTRPTNREECR